MSLDDVVQTLVARGRELRDAGVRELHVGDVRVTFAPPDVIVEPSEPEQDISDPLKDPLTFGRRTSLPGFDREVER